MKIVLFTDTLGDLNGVSRFIQDMGEQASKSTDKLVIVTASKKVLPTELYIKNLPFRFRLAMPFYQELDLVWPDKTAIQLLLKEEKPDLVHISTPGPFGWVAKSVAQKLGLPLMGTYHTDFPAYIRDLTGSSWLKSQTDKVMKKFYQDFEHVFSRSDLYLDLMAKDLGLGENKTSVIYPGTNLARFNDVFKDDAIWQKFGLFIRHHNQRLKVLYVGRINIEKNIPFLCDVWQELMALFPEIKADLVMVGEGRYRKWANKLQTQHAYFLGPVVGEDLSKLYASADLFVFPSTTDTLGQVIMESQASGVPCVVSDIGGPQTLVVNNLTGKIIKADDKPAWVNGLADYLQELANNEKETIKNTKLACRKHMQQYDIKDSFKDFISKHHEVHDKVKTIP